jgi:hypothetical protein
MKIAEPLVQPAAIMRWFKRSGFPDLKPRPGGLPLISRSYFDAVTTSSMRVSIGSTDAPQNAQPNVDAFRAKYGKPKKLETVK